MAPTLMDAVAFGRHQHEGWRRSHFEFREQVGNVLEICLEDRCLPLELVGELVDDAIHYLTRATRILHEVDEDRLPLLQGGLELDLRPNLGGLDSLLEQRHHPNSGRECSKRRIDCRYGGLVFGAMTVSDIYGRTMRDLRISVTDRCNFRCTYCMPKEIFGPDHVFLARDSLLTFPEIVTLVAEFAKRGVHKVRITGGEPLLRKGIEDLIADLAVIPGVDDLTLTTNGSLLARKAESLAAGGLNRVTVSLDALDDPTFQAMNDVGFPVSTVLEAIDVAAATGLGPIKVNAVIKRGVNEHAVLQMAEHFRHSGHIVRFIEFMDVGSTNGWRLDDVVPASEMIETIDEAFPLRPIRPNYPGEVANRFVYEDGAGEVGVIASVTKPFCGSCTRARVSAEGVMYTCLFASEGKSLRDVLRSGQPVGSAIDEVWDKRDDRYSEIRSSRTARLSVPVEMSYIGG